MRDRRVHGAGVAFLIALVAMFGNATDRAASAPAPGPTPTPSRYADRWAAIYEANQHFGHARVESLATSILADVERTRPVDSLEYARAWIDIGVSRIRRQLFADGRGFDALERGLAVRARHARAGDSVLVATHVTAAIHYADGGRVEEGLAHGEAALHLLAAVTPLDTMTAAQAEMAVAVANAYLGRNVPARAAFERALALREARLGRDAASLVPTLAQYGDFLARTGEFDAARALLLRAVKNSAGDTPDGDYLQGSVSRLSTLEFRVGNLAESLELAQRAYELSRSRAGDNAIGTAFARIVLAYRLESLGDWPAGARELRAVLPVLDARLGPENPRTLNARLDLAQDLLNSADTTGARRIVQEVLPALARQEAVASQNRSTLRRIESDLELAAGRIEASRDTLALALADELRKDTSAPRDAFDLLAAAMGTVRGRGDSTYAAGLRSTMDDLRTRTSGHLTPEWIDLVSSRAAAEWRGGLADAAWADALEAERLASRRLAYSLQGLSDRHALSFARQLDDPCEMLVAMTASRPAEAAVTWDRIVRLRGLVAHEIARRRLPAIAGTDTALAALRDHWLAAQRTVAQLVVSGAASPEDSAKRERFSIARGAAEVSERRYLRAANVPAEDDSISLSRVVARLGPGQALVAYAVGRVESREEVLGAFVAGTDHTVRFLKLGDPATLSARIDAWTSALSRPPRGDADARRSETQARRLGARVRAALWDPLLPALGTAHEVFLVPEGALNGVPWLALPVGRDRYLADEPRILHVLDAERELLAPKARESAGLLAIGDPDFELESGADSVTRETGALALRARSWPCAGGPVALPGLPMARAEAEDLVRTWPASAGRTELLIGREAREAVFRRDVSGHAVIHVATHGVMIDDTCGTALPGELRGVGGIATLDNARVPRRPEPSRPAPHPGSPWLSRQVWLAFAGANRTPGSDPDDDGLLTAEEVTTLDLRGTDWVVLSACQSGVAPVWEHEGVLGMRRAFHLAGARTVIASQWPVADAETRRWMNALYRARARETGAGGAVRDACREFLNGQRRAGRSTSPFYWAAFTATGE